MPTVVVVDDTPGITRMVARILNRDGYDVVSLHDGLHLIETIRETKPALVLLDLSLPYKDGWTLIREVRDTVDLAELPVIALSGHCSDDDIAKVRGSGYTDFVSKPFPLTELRNKVEQYAVV
jgi:DNA-binding response OmpR family regulator